MVDYFRDISSIAYKIKKNDSIEKLLVEIPSFDGKKFDSAFVKPKISDEYSNDIVLFGFVRQNERLVEGSEKNISIYKYRDIRTLLEDLEKITFVSVEGFRFFGTGCLWYKNKFLEFPFLKTGYDKKTKTFYPLYTQEYYLLKDRMRKDYLEDPLLLFKVLGEKVTLKENVSRLQDMTSPSPGETWVLPRRAPVRKDELEETQKGVPKGFAELKKLLNSEKQKIDPIYKDKAKMKRYTRVTDLIRTLDFLRTENGFLYKRYNAEIVTNAYLKFLETIYFLDKKFGIIGEYFNTFHMAEAPGNFILALNHYMKTEKPGTKWNWLASTYEEGGLKRRETGYLDDKYGIIEKYREKWILGSENNGDITSVENLEDFAKDCDKIMGWVDLVTSDVKFVDKEHPNFDEEENINKPVHLGHLLGSLICLKPGGTMVLKEFTFFEALSIDLLYIISSLFEKTMIYKPSTSRPANSEIYIVGLGYCGNKECIEFLSNYMRKIRRMNNPKPKNGVFKEYDREFLEFLYTCQKDLVDSQIKEIRRNIQLFNETSHLSLEAIYKKYEREKTEAANAWIEKIGIKKLDERDFMLDY